MAAEGGNRTTADCEEERASGRWWNKKIGWVEDAECPGCGMEEEI